MKGVSSYVIEWSHRLRLEGEDLICAESFVIFVVDGVIPLCVDIKEK